MKRLLPFVASLCATACTNTPIAPQTSAFDRPEDVAFFCWNLRTSSPTALADCRPRTPESIDDDRGEPPDGYALHALVTQTTTGEVAAARLTGAEGEPGIIDTDVRIPGFTFAAVGEVPSALAVSRIDPRHVFVLSRGSADVHVIETARFRSGLGAASTAFRLPGGRSLPSAMRLSPDERALLVAMFETGQVARLPVAADGTLGEADLLDLDPALPDPVDRRGLPAVESWRYTCQAPPLFEPPTIAPREPVALGLAPAPSAMVDDPETGHVLVADGSLPLVHVIDPVTLTTVRTINVSVPLQALALTPRVPATIGATERTERYLYAVDATDGSVLAIEWSDPARPDFGAVLSVEAQPPHDRLNVPFPARALAIVTPGYDEATPTAPCADAQNGLAASGVNLRGVFLAVGTVDGRVRMFDVFDADTACRGFGCGSGRDLNVEDQLVAIGRHRNRIGAYVAEGVVLEPDPSWETDGVGVEVVGTGGGTNAPDLVPALTPVTCPASLSPIYPLEGAPLICAVRDPWAAISQSFSVRFEGPIPFTTTTGGNFEDGGGVLLSATDYCAVGVIGGDDVPDEGYLAGYAGDVVAITGDLPPSVLRGDERRLARCNQLTQRTTAGEVTPVLIAIRSAQSRPEDLHEAYVGRLRLGAVVRPEGASLADVLECYPELLQFEVRTRDVFTVSAGRRGFQHPIVEGADHRCVVDPERAAAGRRGRAFFESVFETSEIRFALGPRPADISGRNPELRMTVARVPVGLSIDISTIGGSASPSLLTRMVYNPVDQRLYAVDQSVQGLLRIKLSRLGIQQTFR